MIEIYVASYNGRPQTAAPKGRFGPEGGTLGRGAENQFVLPDPARHVSRVQARVRYDGSRFHIGNVSEANPLFLNETEIEAGTEKPLAAGDELRIGLYVLGVRVPATAEAAGTSAVAGTGERGLGGAVDPLPGLGAGAEGPNPFADLLGPPVTPPLPIDAAGSLLPPRSPAERSPAAPGASGVATPASSRPEAGTFADLLRPSAPAPTAKDLPQQASAASAPGRADRIPDDFNPFAMPSSAPRNTDDPLRDLAAASIELNAIDAHAKRNSLLEFDLEPKANPRDPMHGGSPSLVDSQDVVDPLRLFGDADDGLLRGSADDALAPDLPMRDSIPEIGAHFAPPRSAPEAPPQAPLARGSPPPGTRVPFVSAPAAPTSPHAPTATSAPHAPAAPSVPSTPSSVPSATATPAAPAPATTIAEPTARTAVPGGIGAPDIDALLAAFLKGARMTELAAPVRLTPGLMELMGTLVYHATAGAMELIAARQITKREIRAEMTMIVAHGNNPLKFLPTPEAAIMQMLGPRMPGFMTTAEAMRDAFDDLRAHEVGVIAGMRAALAEVLRRFDPALLQARLGEGGLLESLVPAARRARLWDLFETRFQELYREANDDFQSLFGEAFTKAYEEQIELDRAQRRQT